MPDASIMHSYGALSSLDCCQNRISLVLWHNVTILSKGGYPWLAASRMVIGSLGLVVPMLETVDNRDIDIKVVDNIVNRLFRFKPSDSLIPLKLIQSWHCWTKNLPWAYTYPLKVATTRACWIPWEMFALCPHHRWMGALWRVLFCLLFTKNFPRTQQKCQQNNPTLLFINVVKISVNWV
jgi:hypothetical protein